METKPPRGRQVIEKIRSGEGTDARVSRLRRMHERFESLMAMSDDQLRIRNSNERIEWPDARKEDLDALRTRSMGEHEYEATIGRIAGRRSQ